MSVARHLFQYEAWMDQGICRGMPTEMFFPPDGDKRAARLAREVCEDCPVRIDCLDYALKWKMRHGVWGGTTSGDRRRLRRAALVASMFTRE